MSNKNVTFKEFTVESVQRIRERIVNENTRIEIEKADADFEENKPARGQTSIKNVKKNLKFADKDFEVGKKLSRKYKHLYPKNLFGRPIEEVDDFYKREYVTSLFLSTF